MTNKIILKMKNLQIDNSSMKLVALNEAYSSQKFRWSYNKENELFIAQFDEFYFNEYKNYSFSVEFKGKLSNEKIGIYKAYEEQSKR